MAEIKPLNILNGKYGYDMRERIEEIPNYKFEEMGDCLGRRMHTENMRRLVIGGDARVTTPAFKEQFKRGLRKHDLHVIDLGNQLPTPLGYVAFELHEADAVAFITASHSSWDWNGIKINLREPDQLKIAGNMQLIDSYGGNVKECYQAYLQQAFAGMGKISLAVDPLWGSYSNYASEVLCSLGHMVISNSYLHNGIKAFPDDLEFYSSDPHKEKNLEHLIKVMHGSNQRKFGLDFGVAFDGDGDRAKFIDDRGEIVSEDEITAIIAKYVIKEHKKKYGQNSRPKIIAEIKSSKLVEDVTEGAGGTLVREQTGRIYIKSHLARDKEIIFGGELSGHYFYRSELGGKPFYLVDTGEDGLFTALLLGKIVQESQRLSSLREELPYHYETTGEIRYNYKKNENKEEVVKEIKQILTSLRESYQKDDHFTYLKLGDDVRVERKGERSDYAALVFRSSKNDPQKFTFVFEAEDKNRLKECQEDFLQRIRSNGYTNLEEGLRKIFEKKS